MVVLPSHTEAFTQAYKVFQSKVVLFNELSGNKVDDENLIPLYINLLKEEAQEIIDATDAIETVDGIVDTLVVGEYLTRLYGYSEGLLTGTNGFKGMGNPDDFHVDVSYLISELNKPEPCAAIIFDTLQYIAISFISCSVNHSGLLNEVADSNLSKFIPSYSMNTDGAQRVCKQIEENTKYNGIDFIMHKEYYVFKDENGKIMKAHSFFKEPELEKYL